MTLPLCKDCKFYVNNDGPNFSKGQPMHACRHPSGEVDLVTGTVHYILTDAYIMRGIGGMCKPSGDLFKPRRVDIRRVERY